MLKLDPLTALVKTPDELLAYLDLVFCSGAMSEKTRTVVTDTLNKLPPNTSDLDRARSALELVVTSYEAAVQR